MAARWWFVLCGWDLLSTRLLCQFLQSPSLSFTKWNLFKKQICSLVGFCCCWDSAVTSLGTGWSETQMHCAVCGASDLKSNYEFPSVKAFLEPVSLIYRKPNSRKWSKDPWSSQREKCSPSDLAPLHQLARYREGTKKPHLAPCLASATSVFSSWIRCSRKFQNLLFMRTIAPSLYFILQVERPQQSRNPMCQS